MTELLTMLATPKQLKNLSAKQKALKELVDALESLKVECTLEQGEIWMWVLFSRFPNAIYEKYLKYGLCGCIQIGQNTISIKLSIYDEQCQEVRAKIGHLRTSLPRLAMSVNSLMTELELKINPLTGQIKLQCQLLYCKQQSPLFLANSLFSKILYRIATVQETLDLLQPEQQEDNYYTSSLIHKLQPLRSLIGQKQAKNIVNSCEQSAHQQYFLPSLPKTKQLNQAQALNVISRMRKIYMTQFAARFMMNNTRSNESNYNYWHADPSPEITSLLKQPYETVNTDFKKIKSVRFLPLRIEGREILLKFQSASPERIRQEYNLSESISKKNLYLPFVNDYIVFRNFPDLKKRYVITKTSEDSCITLKQYLKKNSKTISLLTKLKLMAQVLCIAYICSNKLQNLLPSLNTTNLLLDPSYSIKIDSLCKSLDVNHFKELVQTLYRILANRQYYVCNRDCEDPTKVSSPSFVDLAGFGPAIVIKILLKVFQNLDGLTSSEKAETNSDVIEDSLLTVTRLLDILQKDSVQAQA